jgi:hypothetical protein
VTAPDAAGRDTAPAAAPAEPRTPRWLHALRGWRGALVVYVVFAGAYVGTAGGRLPHHSPYNHYVYLADGWLHGRLSLPGQPPNENDWAKVEVLKLRDGRELRGIYGSRTGGPVDRFYPLRGKPETVSPDQIASRSSIRYVSFPPFPAVLMAPFVAIWGLAFNDVLFNALWAGLNPMLLFLLLRHLRTSGLSRRTQIDDLWLTALFGVGSVYYFCSVVGQVWFSAQIVAVTLSIAFVWASLGGRRPMLAGLFVALGFATRPPWLVLPLFFAEVIRANGGWAALRTREARIALAKATLRFSLPIAVVGAILAVLNVARFGNPFEFGHKFLAVQWQERMFRYGLFNYHFLSRNLAAALILLPRVMDHAPYVKISQHGMSMLVTTPNLAYTVLPQAPSPLRRALWVTLLTTALPSLLYHSSGYVQFGYRYSLDYIVFFMVLLAISSRPLTKVFKGLVLFSFVVNLFLAITFDRYMQFSYDDSFFPHGNH